MKKLLTSVCLVAVILVLTGASRRRGELMPKNMEATSSDYTNNLVAWLKPESLGTAGTVLTRWTNFGGTVDFYAPSGAEPTNRASLLNGYSGAEFQPANNSRMTNRRATVTGPVTVIVVMRPIDSGAVQTAVVDAMNTTTRSLLYKKNSHSSTWTTGSMFTGSEFDVALPGTNSAFTVTAVYNGASSVCYTNGTQSATGTAGNGGFEDGIALGSLLGGTSSHYRGYIFELRAYQGALGTTDRQAAEAALRTKYAHY